MPLFLDNIITKVESGQISDALRLLHWLSSDSRSYQKTSIQRLQTLKSTYSELLNQLYQSLERAWLQLDAEHIKCERISSALKELVEQACPVSTQIAVANNRTISLKIAANYLKIAENAEKLYREASSLADSNPTATVAPLISLLFLFNDIQSSSKQLHLSRVLSMEIKQIFSKIQDQLFNNFSEILTTLNWPKTSAAASNPSLPSDIDASDSSFALGKRFSQLTVLVESLLILQIQVSAHSDLSQDDIPFLFSTDHVNTNWDEFSKITSIEKCDSNHKGWELSSELIDLYNTGLSSEELTIQLQSRLDVISESPNYSSLWVLRLLLKPILTRFAYHFSGTRGTNKISKPEWAIAFILNSVSRHARFLDAVIQPLVSRFIFPFDIRTAFISSLVSVLLQKLSRELPQISRSTTAFRHLVDEILILNSVLINSHGFHPHTLGPMALLVQPQVFESWLIVDKVFVDNALDDIMNSPDVFICTDTSCPPTCAIRTLSLASNAIERITHVELLVLRMQYYDAIIFPLFSNLLSRIETFLKDSAMTLSLDHCVATYANIWSSFCTALNSLQYVERTLSDWGDSLVFIQLKHFSNIQDKSLTTQSLIPDDTTGSIFDSLMNEFSVVRSSFISVLVGLIFTAFEALSHPYTTKQFIMQEDQLSFELSTALCNALNALKTHLITISNHLSPFLFTIIWRRIATKISELFFNQIVVSSKFTRVGAASFVFDMKTLFQLFAEYTSTPQDHFKHLRDAIVLFQLPNSEYVKFSQPSYLESINITSITKEEAIRIVSHILQE